MSEIVKNDTALVEAGEIQYQLTDPQHIIDFSKSLTQFIEASKLSTTIQGNKYPNVDAWKFAGLNFGLVPMVGEPIQLHQPEEMVTILYHEIQQRTQRGVQTKEAPYFSSVSEMLVEKHRKATTTREMRIDHYKYRVPCDIIHTQTGKRVGSGHGLCSNIELKKTSFDEFAVLSMAQTRAVGRAFKNVLGFVVKAAGYEPTPAEEMDGQAQHVAVDDGTMMDIDAALEGCQTLDDVKKLWDDIGGAAQANRSIVAKFKKRKNEINAANK